MDKRSITDINITNKKVIVRVDFNVPLDEKQNIINDKRIKASLPTIKYLLQKNASVILLSHLGRPGGKKVPELSLKPVAKKLSKILEKKVNMLDDCIGEKVEKAIKKMKAGDIVLLENTRFYPEEKKNDPLFSKQLANLGDIFVNDAFGTAHREHSSNVGITQFLPSAIGFLIEEEIKYLSNVLENPEKPFTAILGGVKVSDKIDFIGQLLNKANNILIGGAMMFTFLKSKGYAVGKSFLEENKLETAQEIMKKSKEKNINLLLPEDTVAAKEILEDAEFHSVPVNSIPDDLIGLDIGKLTIKKYAPIIKKSKTVIWNGPMGKFEIHSFSHGTKGIAKAVAECKGTTIIGGGDSAAAIEKFGLSDKVSHVSTGGGASLELLSGKQLPGISVIPDK